MSYFRLLSILFSVVMCTTGFECGKQKGRIGGSQDKRRASAFAATKKALGGRNTEREDNKDPQKVFGSKQQQTPNKNNTEEKKSGNTGIVERPRRLSIANESSKAMENTIERGSETEKGKTATEDGTTERLFFTHPKTKTIYSNTQPRLPVYLHTSEGWQYMKDRKWIVYQPPSDTQEYPYGYYTYDNRNPKNQYKFYAHFKSESTNKPKTLRNNPRSVANTQPPKPSQESPPAQTRMAAVGAAVGATVGAAAAGTIAMSRTGAYISLPQDRSPVTTDFYLSGGNNLGEGSNEQQSKTRVGGSVEENTPPEESYNEQPSSSQTNLNQESASGDDSATGGDESDTEPYAEPYAEPYESDT